MISLLKREHKVDYILKNVVPTAIFEVKCLTWAYEKDQAVRFSYFSHLDNFLILTCYYR